MNRVRGFTLVEALISLVVLSLGLLGSVALLFHSLRSEAHSLRERDALALLSDMAERIRANASAGAAYAFDGAAPASIDCTASECDPTELAAFDLTAFASLAHALFPRDGTATRIDFAPATGSTPAHFTLSLRWDDALSSDNAVSLDLVLPVAG